MSDRTGLYPLPRWAWTTKLAAEAVMLTIALVAALGYATADRVPVSEPEAVSWHWDTTPSPYGDGTLAGSVPVMP